MSDFICAWASLVDLTKPEYQDYSIYNIGSETVMMDEKKIHSEGYDWRIKAGPFGVFEEGFDNGIKLIEYLLGTVFVAIGGEIVA